MIQPRRHLMRLALIGLAAPAVARAQQHPPIDELHGSLTRRSFQMLETSVVRHLDKVLALRISAAPSAPDSGFFCGVENGLFLAYLAPRPRTQVSATGGFAEKDGQVEINGVFRATNAGMNQGILAYALEPVPQAELPPQGTEFRRVELS